MNNGRIKIICDLKPTGDMEQDKLIIPKIIEQTLSLHRQNVADIKRLTDYYFNKTDVLCKEKKQQPDINNKIGIPYANMAVTTINGYCFSNSLTFSSRKVDNEEAMKAFKDSLDDDNYGDKLLKLALNTGICGVGFKYIVPTEPDEIKKGIYYRTSTDIDPTTTYCVYANTLEEEKTCAISFYKRKTYNKDYTVSGSETVYNVWTKYHKWEFVKGFGGWTPTKVPVPVGFSVDGTEYRMFDAYPLNYERIPIVQYYRQQDRTADFEVALDLINAINALASSRVDDVQQSVDYVIVLRDIDTESDGALSKIKACLKEGILSFRSIQEATVQPNIDVLDTKLNQGEVQMLQQFLCDKVEEAMNIPNRETRSSGGDTGSAVESRNGFRSLENKASLVTSSIIKGENEALDVILAICSNIPSCPFSDMKISEVEIKDNRNKYENLTNSSNAYSVLRSAGMNDVTAMQITRLVPDEITVSKMNLKSEEEKAQRDLDKEIERTTRLNALNGNNSTPKQESNNGTNTNK